MISDEYTTFLIKEKLPYDSPVVEAAGVLDNDEDNGVDADETHPE